MNILKLAACAGLVLGLGVAKVDAASRGYSLVVVPDRYSVLQIGFDLIAREPAVLCSYQGQADTADPTIYAWNGAEWVYVSLKDFREVNFLQKMPDRVILVGDDKTLPTALAEAAGWAKQVDRVTRLSTSDLINDFGRILKFSGSDWKWYAARYNLKLTDESEPLRKASWYDQPGPLRRPPLKDVVGKDEATVRKESEALEAATGSSETTEVAPLSDTPSIVVTPVEPAADAAPAVEAAPAEGQQTWSEPAYVEPAPVVDAK